MATSRRRTAKKNLGQNINDLDRRLKTVERRPRSTVSSWSITSDMLAPGLITLEKLSPELLALLQQTYSSGDSTGDTAEEQGYGITDAIISSAEFSTNAANGKNSLFFAPTAPSEGTYLVDDIWYDTSPDTDGRAKYTPYQWDGDSWEPAPFGDAAFRFLNAGKIATGVLDAAAIVRVGQYPTSEGFSRLEISGGSGSIEFTTELVSAVTSSATTITVTDVSGLPTENADYNLKIDSGTPDEEVVLVTNRVGTVLTVTRGVSGSAAAHDAGASIEYASTLYAGISVLKNPVGSGLGLDSASQAALPALFRLNASEGSLFLGEGDDFLKFNTSDSPGRLSISGRLLVGTGAESVSIGADISGDQDGIRLGPNNWWYRPTSTLAEFPSGGVFFRVGGSGNRLISAHTDGTVVVEGTVNPTEGQIKGRLSIRLPEQDASDKFLIGRDVGALAGLTGVEWDGIRLNAQNYFVLSNNASQSHFRVGDGNEYVRFNSAVATGKLTISGQLQAGTGAESLLVGRNVAAGNRDGIQLGPVNFWYRPESVTGTNPVFQVSDGTPNPTFIKLNRNGKVTFSGEIQGSTSTGPITTPNDFRFGNNIISGTKDGLYFNANNFWLLPNADIANNEEFFKIASGGPNSTTTYISIRKGGEVLIKGYHQGGVIEAPITTPPTPVAGEEMRLGADVSGNKDGLFLNASNYWYVPDSIDDGSFTFRVGGTNQFMSYNTAADTLSVSGTISATAGLIGGWTIASTGLSSGTGTSSIGLVSTSFPGTVSIYSGSATAATAPFRVTNTGNLFASNATITGAINATSGFFGLNATDGWNIDNNTLKSKAAVGGSRITLDALNSRISISSAAVPSYNSATTGFYADAAGFFSLGSNLFYQPKTADGFGNLTVVGRIRGAIDNVPIVPADSGQFSVTAVTISGTSPNQTATLTTSATHTFAVEDTVIVTGLTGNAASANGAWKILSKATTSFTVTGLSGAVNGTYTGLSGTARVRELTLGLHPAFNGSPAGLGIRLDENNYWFINNLFKVGSPISFVSWDGATLRVTGEVNATAGNFTNTITVGSNATLSNRITIAGGATAGTTRIYSGVGTYANTNTPFYLDAAGNFSIGDRLSYTTATGLAINGSGSFSGSISATGGTIGGFTIGSTSLTAGAGATAVGVATAGTHAFYAGSATPGSAPFRVTPGGVLTASGASISGTITGSTINGSIFQSSDSLTTAGVKVISAASVIGGYPFDPGILFYLDAGSQIPASISAYAFGGDRGLNIFTGRVPPGGTRTFIKISDVSTSEWIGEVNFLGFVSAASFRLGATTVINSSGNITNVGSISASGSVSCGGVSSSGGVSGANLQVSGTNVVNASRQLVNIAAGSAISPTNFGNTQTPLQIRTSDNVLGIVGSNWAIKTDIAPLNSDLPYSFARSIPEERLSSSARHVDFKDALAIVPCEYSIIEDGSIGVGFIVEDLVEKFPAMVTYDKSGPVSYNTTPLVAAMLAIIQEHEKEIKELKTLLNAK